MVYYFFPPNTTENEAYAFLRDRGINTWYMTPRRNGVYFWFER